MNRQLGILTKARKRPETQMAEELRLDIEPPIHGWSTVRLTAPTAALDFVASYTPRDSISDLAGATAGLVAGLPEQIVTWNTEPVEYDFRFVTARGWTRLEIRQFVDHRRQRGRTGVLAAVIEGDAVAVARALWCGLGRLQGAVSAEEFAAAWRHPFPAAVVERLGEQLRRLAVSVQVKVEPGAGGDGGGT
jgi:hypothetical protein